MIPILHYKLRFLYPKGIYNKEYSFYYFHQIKHLREELGCAVTCAAMLMSAMCSKEIHPTRVFNKNKEQCFMHWNDVALEYGCSFTKVELPKCADSNQRDERILQLREYIKGHSEGIILQISPADGKRGHFLVLQSIGDSGDLFVADPMGYADKSVQTEPINLYDSYTYNKYGDSVWDKMSGVLYLD